MLKITTNFKRSSFLDRLSELGIVNGLWYLVKNKQEQMHKENQTKQSNNNIEQRHKIYEASMNIFPLKQVSYH